MTPEDEVQHSENAGEQGANQPRVTVNKLKLNKETVEDLTDSDIQQIKGGAIVSYYEPPPDKDTKLIPATC